MSDDDKSRWALHIVTPESADKSGEIRFLADGDGVSMMMEQLNDAGPGGPIVLWGADIIIRLPPCMAEKCILIMRRADADVPEEESEQ